MSSSIAYLYHAPYSLLSMLKRCGVKDADFNLRRVRRYAVGEYRWNKNRTVTYRLLNGPKIHNLLHPEWYGLLNKAIAKKLVEEAFKEWAPYCGLKFKQLTSGRADITLSFESGDHKDGHPFIDTGVLAHAVILINDGTPIEVHFNDEVIWVVDRNSTYSFKVSEFYAIALHEIGHTLGLEHSDNMSSIMYKSENHLVRSLHQDDKVGMRTLYNNFS